MFHQHHHHQSTRISKLLLVLTFVLFLLILFYSWKKYNADISEQEKDLAEHKKIVYDFFAQRKSWNTSNLGSMLFKYEEPIFEEIPNKTFYVVVYKFWQILRERHLYYFTERKHDPLEDCSVKNCKFAGSDEYFPQVDALITHLQRGYIPVSKDRDPHQRWIFLDDESPRNTFSYAKKTPTWRQLSNVFNWSMTYRSDADIPVPYGRTVALEAPLVSLRHHSITELIPYWSIKRRDVLINILISHCGINYRTKIMEELEENLYLHVFGECGDTNSFSMQCPGHYKEDCSITSRYLFYLVLENSKCKEYLTEKVFNHAYLKGAIPVIQGPSLEDCNLLLPPNSFIHLDKYGSIQDFSKDLIRISKDENLLLSFHAWRNHFKVVNEHGYFGSRSYHYCRVCEALNYNDRRVSIYNEDDIRRFLDPKYLCR